jgi:hypothetical protein
MSKCRQWFSPFLGVLVAGGCIPAPREGAPRNEPTSAHIDVRKRHRVVVDGGVDRPRFRVQSCEDGTEAKIWSVSVFGENSQQKICDAEPGARHWRYGEASTNVCAPLVVGGVYSVLISSAGLGLAISTLRATDAEWAELKSFCVEDRMEK